MPIGTRLKPPGISSVIPWCRWQMSTDRFNRLKDNLSRVDSLLALYQILQKEEARRLVSSKQDARSADILRAAVVLLHGSQEDYVRGMLSDWLFDRADSRELEGISLRGSAQKRAQKFTLRDLAQYKNEQVSDLIQSSIESQLSLVSFNQYSEICSWLSKIGISLTQFKNQSLIENLIKRRHKIVHEVDLNKKSGKTESIKASTVRSWREAVENMLRIVDEQIEGWDAS